MPLPTDRLEVKIAGYLRAREKAALIGDVNLLRAINADLARTGYRDAPIETTEAPAMTERAVPEPTPKRKPGRPPKVRAEF